VTDKATAGAANKASIGTNIEDRSAVCGRLAEACGGLASRRSSPQPAGRPQTAPRPGRTLRAYAA